MNNNLDEIRIIESAKLNSEFYFQSLLEQAHAKDMLDDEDVERLQFECYNFLAYKVERYNAGDSSSIQVEKAESVMTSILFTVGLWLKTYANPDNAVTELKTESIKDIYKKGRKRIDTMILSTRTVHGKLLSKLLDTKNCFYKGTLDDGIKGFFKLYYPDFGAQEIHITADYPLYNSMPRLAGIEFIKKYVENAYCENLFCSNFDSDDIHYLLYGHAENYKDLLINIYELVLTTAIGCVIAGGNTQRLNLTESGVEYLKDYFYNMSDEEILKAIEKASDELNYIFQFPNELKRYIENSLPLIAKKIEIGVINQTFEHVFITPHYPENNPKISFSFGEKMDNEQYRKVIDEIAQCRFLQDKISIIKERVVSLADLEDVLLDAQFSQNEISVIWGELGLPEIAAFSKRYFLGVETDLDELSEQEQVIRKSLKEFVSGLPEKQQEFILKASKAIEEE